MKNRSIYRAIATFSMIFIFSTCSEDRLEITPQQLTEFDYFTEELDFHRAIGGVYAKVGEFYHYHYNNPRHMFYLLPGDDLTTDGDIPFEVFSTLESGNGYLSSQFGYAYELITRANIALEKLYDEEISSVIKSAESKNALIGEALFLRSYMNILLWNYWGNPPLITERIISQDGINPPSSEGTQLLDQAISDLGEAANLLPDSWPDSDRGRVTKNSANGLLGKALVIRASWTGNSGDYDAAKAAFAKVTARLMDNYGDNFSVYQENNEESLFEYQASNIGTDNIWLSNDQFSSIGTFSAYYGYFNDNWSFWAHTPYVATQKLMDTFEDGDPRAAQTFNPENSFILKYVTEDASTNGAASFNNPRILRYADVLLLWAEALNETGDQDGAIAKINQVRTRARNMDTTGIPADRPAGASQSEVRTWIQQERLIELGAEEGHRWIDLRRWHQAGHIDLGSWDFSSRKTDFSISIPKNLFYPIPNSELDKNPNVVQNEGY